MNRSYIFSILSALSIVGSAACASGVDDDATADDEIKKSGGNSFSGFDIQGPKALPAAPVGSICAAVLSREKEACQKVRGDITRVGCRDLCSIPIADDGKAAGYDLDGFRQLASDKIGTTFCAQAVTPERAACEQVGGVVSAANDCKELCSKPIAPRGKSAGYDLKGFKILPSAGAPTEFCAAVVSPVQSACSRVKGTLSHVDGCGHLCSLPL